MESVGAERAIALPRSSHHVRHMAASVPIASTVRYLRFPLAEDHRALVRDGTACPHCNGQRIQKWGRFSSRQRYRCRNCGRTFSTFTGTALRYLKHPDRWRRFLWCVDGRLTVRKSAAVLGVDKDTALRWRHRLLDQWRQERMPRLTGSLVIGSFSVPHSAKGSRSLDRPPRRRREDWSFPSIQTGPVMVLVARSSPQAMLIKSVAGRIRSKDYDRVIGPRAIGVSEIVGSGGPSCPVALFANRLSIPYRWEPRSFSPLDVFIVRSALRAWLRPFHGVSTRRLDNYLEWFRRSARNERLQQFPRTASYRPTHGVGGAGWRRARGPGPTVSGGTAPGHASSGLAAPP